MERYSKQRELILNVLKERKDHPTADVVYMNVREQLPNISLGTVYRYLTLLSDLGEVLRLRVGDGYESGQILKIETKQGESDRFDGNLMPHLHFQCLECNEIQDIFLDECDND